MKSFFFLFTLLSAGLSQAGQVACAGRYQNAINFWVNAQTDSSNRIIGRIQVKISGGGTDQTSQLIPRSSDIQPGRLIRFSGSNSTGSGEIDAPFNERSKKYSGRLIASGSGSRVEVPVACSLR